VREILLQPEGGAGSFPSGSHIGVRVLIDGKLEQRYYSLVGEAPEKDCWRIAVKREDAGRGGSRYMWSLPVGARLEVAEPDSHFDLSREAPDILLIAGGIGITPLVGMAQRLARSDRRFRLLYAGRDRAAMPYLDELAAIAEDRLDVFASREGRRIDLAAEFARLDPRGEAYVCGPISLLEGARSAWQASGRKPERFVCETFGSSGRFAPETFKVNVRPLDISVSVPVGQSMLDALEAAGIGVVADCRRGECGLCAVDVVACTGSIDHRDVFLSPAQHARNDKLCVCVSRVVGGEITIDAAYRSDAPLRSGPELKQSESA
jgi:vanillate O-demethylase ferredoxin subunit